jgi:hypothetical protein
MVSLDSPKIKKKLNTQTKHILLIMSSYISYFIPADGDSEEHPNVFLIRKPQKEIKTSDVTASFPLPGTYHFRAKQPLAKAHSELVIASSKTSKCFIFKCCFIKFFFNR